MSKRRVYLAGPFFSVVQETTIQALEVILTERDVEFFSPRWGKPELMKDRSNAAEVFENNLVEMAKSTEMLAIIDDFDPGTVWEMGWYYHRRLQTQRAKRIIAVSLAGHGLNLMLHESCNGFLQGLEAVDKFYSGDESVLVIERPIKE